MKATPSRDALISWCLEKCRTRDDKLGKAAAFLQDTERLNRNRMSAAQRAYLSAIEGWYVSDKRGEAGKSQKMPTPAVAQGDQLSSSGEEPLAPNLALPWIRTGSHSARRESGETIHFSDGFTEAQVDVILAK